MEKDHHAGKGPAVAGVDLVMMPLNYFSQVQLYAAADQASKDAARTRPYPPSGCRTRWTDRCRTDALLVKSLDQDCLYRRDRKKRLSSLVKQEK